MLTAEEIIDSDLGGGAGVQGIQQFGVAQKHGGLVLLRGNRIVDVAEPDGFRELAPKLKNPIWPEAADGDSVLDGSGEGKALPILLQGIL